MKTYFQSNEEALAARKWVVVDAKDQVVGRLATRVASILRGKNNPAYCPHNDDGDFVVIVNAKQVQFTGRKISDKCYYRHTGYTGGIKQETAAQRLQRKPEDVIISAVKGMLPKNVLGRKQLKKLKVYSGPEHPHLAQCADSAEVK